MTQSAIQASGLGYNGTTWEKDKTKIHRWDKIVNINLWEFETSTSLVTNISLWNNQVTLFLKNYIHDRMATTGKRAPWYAANVTFIYSAIWHGFTLMGYIPLWGITCCHAIGKVLYKSRYLVRDVPLALRCLFGFFVTQLLMSFSIASYTAKDNDQCIGFLKATYYANIWLLPALLVLAKVSGVEKRAKLMETQAGLK